MTEPIIKDKEELFDISDGLNKDWWVAQRDESGGKHDVTNVSLLLRYNPNGKFYGVKYGSSYNYGIQFYEDFPYAPDEVEVTFVTTYTWKVKKKAPINGPD